MNPQLGWGFTGWSHQLRVRGWAGRGRELGQQVIVGFEAGGGIFPLLSQAKRSRDRVCRAADGGEVDDYPGMPG